MPDLSHMPAGAVEALKAGFESELAKARTLHAVIFGIILYDLLVCLPAEIRRVWRARFTPMSACYVVARYFTLSAFALILWLERWPSTYEECNKAVRLTVALPIVTYIAGSVLVIHRIYSIWERDVRVLGFLYILLVAVIAIQITTAVKTEANPLLPLLGISACTPAGGNNWFYPFYACITAFDMAAVLLGSIKLYSAWKSCKTRLVRTLMVESLMWLVACTVAVLVTLLYHGIAPETHNKALLSPLATAVESIAACRMLLAIREGAVQEVPCLTVLEEETGSKTKIHATSSVPHTPVTCVSFGSPRLYEKSPLSQNAMLLDEEKIRSVV